MPSLAPRHIRRECAMTIYVITRNPIRAAAKPQMLKQLTIGHRPLSFNAGKRGLIASTHVAVYYEFMFDV